MVRSTSSRRPSSMRPPGISEFCRATASRTFKMGILYAASRSASTHTLMARFCPPTTCTSPTPLTDSMASRTSRSAISKSSRGVWVPASTTLSTGDESVSSFLINGGLASRGSRLITVATASRTSCAAMSMSRFRVNVMVRIEVLSVEVARMLSIPSTVATASSRRRVMVLSISSGEAPSSMVRTVMIGRSTLGKRSTPSLV